MLLGPRHAGALALRIPADVTPDQRRELHRAVYRASVRLARMVYPDICANVYTPEELAENKIVREKYLSNSFVLRRKDFMK